VIRSAAAGVPARIETWPTILKHRSLTRKTALRVRIVYRSVKHWTEPEPLATVVVIIDGGTTIDREQVRREVEQLHVDRSVDGAPRDGLVSDDRLHNHSWGASATTLEIIVSAAYMAVGGIVGGAAWDGLKSIARRIGARRGSEQAAEALDGQRAEWRAKQMAAASFPAISADLTVLAVTLDSNSATVVMRATDGSTTTARPSLAA
jgi:hypothetical protein